MTDKESRQPFADFARRFIPRVIRNNYCIFPDKPRTVAEYSPDLDGIDKIRSRMAPIRGAKKIDATLDYCKGVYLDEESRRSLVESKATILAGFSATSTAGILALFGILLSSERFWQILTLARFASIALIILILLMLAGCTLSSIRALAISTYHRPNPRDIFELSTKSLDEVKKERATSYFHAYMQNHFTNSRKIDSFRCGLSYFRNAIICLGILVPVIGIYGAYNPFTRVPSATHSTPTATAIGTPPVLSTPTLTLVPSLNLTSPAISTPSATATLIPPPTQ